ncbi:MAG: DUF4912 domain-containing protein [Chitinispirillia bacterium]|nr:DUF4912 domain-containing protein [Chitinispirillia bacterium]
MLIADIDQYQDDTLLRELCWEIGQRFPETFSQELFSLLAVYPHLGFLQWHVSQETAARAKACKNVSSDNGCSLVIRVYDVTGVEFDGFNANHQYDIHIQSLCGCYYLNVDRFESTLMAEVGYLFSDGSFKPCIRSNVMYFDRPRKSSCFRTAGLYVSSAFRRVFPVEDVKCAPVFDGMNSILEKADVPQLGAAIFLNESAVSDNNHKERPVTRFLLSVIEKCRAMGAAPQVFTPDENLISKVSSYPLIKRARFLSKEIAAHFERNFKPSSFGCVQCHDWYSAPVAMNVSRKHGLPLIAVIHSLEIERCCGQKSEISEKIERLEQKLINAACGVLVAGESLREIVIRGYGKPKESVFIVPDTLTAVSDSNTLLRTIECIAAMYISRWAGAVLSKKETINNGR